jgi:4-hydroxythreonine-4-phosphate dehydrogenase
LNNVGKSHLTEPGNMTERPRLLITMGDVAGIGPEIIARAWPELNALCRPVVVGDVEWVGRAVDLVKSPAAVQEILDLDAVEPGVKLIPCLKGSSQELNEVRPGEVSAAAGRAAYDFLCLAISQTLAGHADGIVTAPIHKEGLRSAGLPYPGHTEILAERTDSKKYAMMLFLSPVGFPSPGKRGMVGLGVAHVTLHLALREVFQHLSTPAVLDKIQLLDGMLSRLLERRPRIGVAALNPHASDGSLFGDEEAEIIEPAVKSAQREGINVSGPWPSDTLFVRAKDGEFDGIVAMYHDQGHIALKLLGGRRAVNISAGLPLVRTSVAHGTAYDIAGNGIADPSSLIEAARVAAKLVVSKSEW